jgi:Mrp family chromosome partitioning ATPase/DUF971 family protein
VWIEGGNLMNDKKNEVLDALRSVVDPDLNRDIVSLGFVKNLEIDKDSVSFTVELTTPACPLKASFKKLCEEAVKSLAWVKNVSVEMSARKQPALKKETADGLSGTARIIAVSSCKGGVGKSTTAVNLAFALAKSGAAVGLLDADIYGPSLPTLVYTGETGLYRSGDLIAPVEFDGVKLMSFGYASDPKKAAVMRGPMVSGIISQLAAETDWGPLDYLIVDMPPGTGDIQLTLTQRLPFSGAVIVTTPQKLSFVDVVKGMQMFETVKVPTLAVVENMSFFVCPGCKEKHFPFGKGAMARIAEQYGIENTFEIPMVESLTQTGDNGLPLVLSDPSSPVAKLYETLASATVREVAKLENGAVVTPTVVYEKDRGIAVRAPSGDERLISPADLRRRCRCASCVDEHTGEQILKPEDVSEDVYPLEIEKMGNYAIAVKWSDGHNSSIYPYDRL